MSAESSALSPLEAYFRQHRDRHLAELHEVVRIPSVSALPANAIGR